MYNLQDLLIFFITVYRWAWETSFDPACTLTAQSPWQGMPWICKHMGWQSLDKVFGCPSPAKHFQPQVCKDHTVEHARAPSEILCNGGWPKVPPQKCVNMWMNFFSLSVNQGQQSFVLKCCSYTSMSRLKVLSWNCSEGTLPIVFSLFHHVWIHLNCLFVCLTGVQMWTHSSLHSRHPKTQLTKHFHCLSSCLSISNILALAAFGKKLEWTFGR